MRLCVRPAALEVLSDVPSTLSLLRRHEASPSLEVLCCPADLIRGDMLRHAADHYVRAVEALAGVSAGVLLEDVTSVDGEAAPCAPGAGLIPPAAWRAVLEIVRASGRPLVASGLATPEGLRRVGWGS